MAQLKLSREEIVSLVTSILSNEGTEEEDDAMIKRLRMAVDHPQPSNVLFKDRRFSRLEGAERVERIVDELINYKPILL